MLSVLSTVVIPSLAASRPAKVLFPVPLVPANSTATLLRCSCMLHAKQGCHCSAGLRHITRAAEELLPVPLVPAKSTATLLRCSCMLRANQVYHCSAGVRHTSRPAKVLLPVLLVPANSTATLLRCSCMLRAKHECHCSALLCAAADTRLVQKLFIQLRSPGLTGGCDCLYEIAMAG